MSGTECKSRISTGWRNALVVLGLAAVFGLIYGLWPGFRGGLNRGVAVMARADIPQIRSYLLSFGVWAPVVSGGLIILHAVLFPLPSVFISIANGLLFGAFWGTLLTWSTSMVSAVLTYWIAHALGRPIIERAVSAKALDASDRILKLYGNRAVFIARLVPGLSFDVVGYAAGLAATPFLGFMIATAFGNLPGTILYVEMGNNLTKGHLFVWIGIGLVVVVGGLGLLFRRAIVGLLTERQKDRRS